MDIEMTIVLAIAYIVFIAWGYSKKSGETSVNVLPEQSDYDYTEYFPNEQLEDSYEQSSSVTLTNVLPEQSDYDYTEYFPNEQLEDSYINYFPELENVDWDYTQYFPKEQLEDSYEQSSSETLTDVLPEQSDYDYTEYFPNEQLEDSYEGSDCGYINYFPELEMDDEEEFNIESSSSSSTGVIVADPWEQDVVVTPIEFEFNVTQLEYQLALPPAIEQDVVVAKVKDTESIVGWAHQEEFDTMMAMSIRQLKQMAKELSVPKYGSLCKEDLCYRILSWKDCGCGQDILTRLFNIERTEGCVSDNDLVEQCNINGIDFVKTAIKGTKFYQWLNAIDFDTW